MTKAAQWADTRAAFDDNNVGTDGSPWLRQTGVHTRRDTPMTVHPIRPPVPPAPVWVTVDLLTLVDLFRVLGEAVADPDLRAAAVAAMEAVMADVEASTGGEGS